MGLNRHRQGADVFRMLTLGIGKLGIKGLFAK